MGGTPAPTPPTSHTPPRLSPLSPLSAVRKKRIAVKNFALNPFPQLCTYVELGRRPRETVTGCSCRTYPAKVCVSTCLFLS